MPEGGGQLPSQSCPKTCLGLGRSHPKYRSVSEGLLRSSVWDLRLAMDDIERAGGILLGNYSPPGNPKRTRRRSAYLRHDADYKDEIR